MNENSLNIIISIELFLLCYVEDEARKIEEFGTSTNAFRLMAKNNLNT